MNYKIIFSFLLGSVISGIIVRIYSVITSKTMEKELKINIVNKKDEIVERQIKIDSIKEKLKELDDEKNNTNDVDFINACRKYL